MKQSYRLRVLLLLAMANVQCSIFNVQCPLFNVQCSTASAQVKIGGNVYGGGNEGAVGGNSQVTITDGEFGALASGSLGATDGNIYGGGNAADLAGHTTVTLRGGNIYGGVFGGARMANIGKRTYVNVDGENQKHDLTVNFVFGGNDISGTIGTTRSAEELPFTPEVNTEAVGTEGTEGYVPAKTLVTADFQAFIHTTPETGGKHTFIGQMFGGGNGSFTYTQLAPNEEGYIDAEHPRYKIIRNEDGSTVGIADAPLSAPTVGKTYVQVNGGTFGYVFAGGNAATVTDAAVISINNSSDITDCTSHLSIKDYVKKEDLATANLDAPVDRRLLSMGLNLSTFETGRHQFLRIFGGNNKIDMTIRPQWNLARGSVVNLYSGGNEGRMTHHEGILLEIPATSQLTAENVYGGCRKADVTPLVNGVEVPYANIQLSDERYKFPAGYSARVLVRGGHITNVYGGNDISGTIRGGNAVGVYTSISGDVYGGGNGSYAYTDNPAMKGDLIWGDFYYNPREILPTEAASWTYPAENATATQADQLLSARALNKVRPNAEQVSIRLYSDNPERPTVIKGSVYLGGNSASLTTSSNAAASTHLKIGSNVIADNVFFGNNGANMVDATPLTGVLAQYAGNAILANQTTQDFSSLDLTNANVFAEYMKGCAMETLPEVKYDSRLNGDPDDYEPYSSMFGSVYGGGNVGSMITAGKTTFNFTHPIIVYNKLVGGCNNANVPASTYNAAYYGGVLGVDSELAPGGLYTEGKTNDGNIRNRLVMNLDGIRIRPMRWNSEGTALEWDVYNTAYGTDAATNPVANVSVPTTTDTANADDLNRRLRHGNIYGGCYNSGHINGNVVINLNGTLIDDDLFDEISETGKYYELENFTITKRNSGVLLAKQGMDPLGTALNVFGGGYGAESEVWGSATVNLNSGFTFQIFGGGEAGLIGRYNRDASGNIDETTPISYDRRYSTYVNMNDVNGTEATADNDVAEAIFIYGGGFEGPIAGNTVLHLDNGRLFNSFAGSCNADIYGHTETYVGQNGFPYFFDHLYGANDLGGRILGETDLGANGADCNFLGSVRSDIRTAVHGYNSATPSSTTTTASAYVEYIKGHVENIFGGCYGDYDYSDAAYGKYFYATGATDIPSGKKAGDARPGYYKPQLGNAFVNFKPGECSNELNGVKQIYGGGQGHTAEEGFDPDMNEMQERGYVLIDIPQDNTHFTQTRVFGAGAKSGLGMHVKPETMETGNADLGTAVVDLFRGQIKEAYGGSYEEGVTRRTVVNVPAASTAEMDYIYGGAYGNNTFKSCDVYESHVNWRSATAKVGTIFGGNSSERRTVYAHVDAYAPVQSKWYAGSYATIYGAGYGKNCWAEYTEVNLHGGATVYEVYGGGQDGKVLNAASVQKYREQYTASLGIPYYSWRLGDYYIPTENLASPNYAANDHTNLFNTAHPGIVRRAELPDPDNTAVNTTDGGVTYGRYNTNVIIHEGATVKNYAYGGGKGAEAFVSGTAYLALLGGTVEKDIYGSGTEGDVRDAFGVGVYNASSNPNGFTASTNVYIGGGTARNVYGGGWQGCVGQHSGSITRADHNAADVLGMANVVVGRLDGTSITDGIPASKRNGYGGGEGGSVWGTARVTMNNGYVGYRYNADDADDGSTTGFDERYEEELTDDDLGSLDNAGNIFGGGYVANSYTDASEVTMYGGNVRGSLYGGGEIGPIGRGTVAADSTTTGAWVNDAAKIYKGGSTQVTLYGGHVMRDVFGGGRGFDNWGGDGTKVYQEKFPHLLVGMDLTSKGYVFGTTSVRIRGGVVGTNAGVAQGYGNIFGGGNVGNVYGNNTRKKGSNPNTINTTNGLPTDGGGYYYINDSIANGMSLDANVDVAPYCRVTAPVTINSHDYVAGVYVPVEDLNTLRNKSTSSSEWSCLNDDGIIIHNAIFAGGNTTAGSDQVYVNAKSVFGNAIATVRDLYHRDLITIGTEHTGGLYGDGNLTFVDGYRGLHIANYGTDYYNMDDNITLEQYKNLNDRERAYFQLRFICQQPCTDNKDKSYKIGDELSEEDYEELFDGSAYANTSYWVEKGFCSIWAGRLLNTIQRADFVGIFGSRLVLQGALDRVPEKADYTKYTINRVGELSLNQQPSTAGDTDPKDAVHGNYFGIYSVVNYLGNLTSDVKMSDVRTSANKDYVGDGTTTWHNFKDAHKAQQSRNYGTSPNKVALASGVHLELIREASEKSGQTEWGYITGVIELDLLNVMQGMGGGYVYAKNEHHTKEWHSEWKLATLSPYNLTARTRRRFTYLGALQEIQTSGNFVHDGRQIVDDCFPTIGSYSGDDASPAHYWYIKGSVYVYDQYISAYTGSTQPYSQNVTIPLTITAASHGRLTLREVQPNRYAYYDKNGRKLGSEGADETIVANNLTYHLNDPISFWEWNQLSSADTAKFVKETYVTVADCKLIANGDTIVKGTVYLPTEFEDMKETYQAAATDSIYNVERGEKCLFTDIFRPSNNVSHNTGYALTYDLTNPMLWDKWYTLKDSTGHTEPFTVANRKNTDQYDALPDADKNLYHAGPTYTALKTKLYGQKEYAKGDIIDNNAYTNYKDINDNYPSLIPSGQAAFERAYVVTSELTITDDGSADTPASQHHLYPGVTIAHSDYDNDWSAADGKVAEALVCTNTLQLSETDYIFMGDILTADSIAKLKERYPSSSTDIDGYFSNAYICSGAGLYGGKVFHQGHSYSAVDALSNLSAADREDFSSKFTYNYDALDLLIDPTYSGDYGDKDQYDGTNSPKIYTAKKEVDYQAIYKGESALTYTDQNSTSHTIAKDSVLTRQQYEDLPNEQVHYSPIRVKDPGTYYVVKEAFIRGDIPYTVGQAIDVSLYNALGTNQQKVDVLTFKNDGVHTKLVDPNDASKGYQEIHYYYCREGYTVGEKGMGQSVQTCGVKTADIKRYGTQSTDTAGATVPQGIIIDETNYSKLVNKTVTGTGAGARLAFDVVGNTPLETSTLYVSRESDINDLTKEKIITVVYLYEYNESDESGTHITPISERHVVNIHLEFKTGVPEIGELTTPATVLPGSTVGLRVPVVKPGAFEVLGGGWELYESEDDALMHRNGVPYVNNGTPMYWYQDGYNVAYYTKTYLGKTYSNPVELSVANYHDIDRVMTDSLHHMYIDHTKVKRAPKIYIDGAAATDPAKSKLDLLADLFTLTLHPREYSGSDEVNLTGYTDLSGTRHTYVEGDTLYRHRGVNTTQIGAAKNLEFFLRANVSLKKYTVAGGSTTGWTPIASGEGQCFQGTIHGDGHTISGLDHSLIGSLCGNVYNLGVTGPFTSAGVADTGDGYVENCWVYSTAAPSDFPAEEDDRVYAVFGNPTAGSGTQVKNCYYPETNGYKAAPGGSSADEAPGYARPMPLRAFHNGEVAYNLNGFYLQKRYFDNTLSSGTSYKYYRANADGSLPSEASTAYYTSDYATKYRYVEDRYADGDFIYAGGTVPEGNDQRYAGNDCYYPIWPDDYLFFGQALTYDHVEGRSYQPLPANINKSGSRLYSFDAADNNRVYRAPAYYRSGTMSAAYYNPFAVFAQTQAGQPDVVACQDMTAIDFTGSNGDVSGTPANDYKQGLQSNGRFFPPLLDHDGLTALRNVDLTHNLLVYTPSAPADPAAGAGAVLAATRTYNVVTTYLHDAPYAETNADYRTVAAQNSPIYGHAVVKQQDGTFTTQTDHFLVDRHDFYVPIAYTMAGGKRMWYQRTPERFANRTTGWETVSLPFEAEVVTTQQKGELTHLYKGSPTNHEYWLREFQGNLQQKRDADNNPIEGVYTADFNSPDAITGGADKKYTNTFLWDYYYKYSADARQDQNTDTYQQQYYATTQTHAGYPYSAKAKPYIIGFPGSTYYEFDLSGTFQPLHTLQPVDRLQPQVVTFASRPAVAVAPSEGELAAAAAEATTADGYTFTPNYLGKTLAADDADDYYVMQPDGAAFKLMTTDTLSVPFRAYFVKKKASPARQQQVQRICFNQTTDNFGVEDRDPSEGYQGTLVIRAVKGKIVVESTLSTTADVRIVTAGGNALTVFTIEPGQTIDTRISSTGIYIVTASDGQTKKLRVEAR